MDVLAVAVPGHPREPNGPAGDMRKGLLRTRRRRDCPSTVRPKKSVVTVPSSRSAASSTSDPSGNESRSRSAVRVVVGHDLQERRVVGRVEEPIGFVDQIEAAVGGDPARGELAPPRGAKDVGLSPGSRTDG